MKKIMLLVLLLCLGGCQKANEFTESNEPTNTEVSEKTNEPVDKSTDDAKQEDEEKPQGSNNDQSSSVEMVQITNATVTREVYETIVNYTNQQLTQANRQVNIDPSQWIIKKEGDRKWAVIIKTGQNPLKLVFLWTISSDHFEILNCNF